MKRHSEPLEGEDARRLVEDVENPRPSKARRDFLVASKGLFGLLSSRSQMSTRDLKLAPMSVAEAETPVVRSHDANAEALVHLLAVLRSVVRLLDELGRDVDARVVEAHVAQLARGKEWPGDPIAPVVFSDGSTSGDAA